MDLIQFAAKIKKQGDSFTIQVPQKDLDKLQLKEGDAVVVEIRKYLTHISPRFKR